MKALMWALMILPFTANALAAGQPTPVSPGDPRTFKVVQAACPTFSWGAVAEAEAHELVVYRVDTEGQAQADPTVRVTLPGTAGSWTPSLEQCLERGQAYAWSVRAHSKGDGRQWSDASLFRVAPGPTVEEVEAALAVLRSFMEQQEAADYETIQQPAGFQSRRAPSLAAAGPTAMGSAASAVPFPSFTRTGFRAEVPENLTQREDLAAVHGIAPGANYVCDACFPYRVGVYGEALNGSWEGHEFGVLGAAAGGVGVRGDGAIGGQFTTVYPGGKAIDAHGDVYIDGELYATGLEVPGSSDYTYASTGDLHPEMYAITASDAPPCDSGRRGRIRIMRPDEQPKQDSLCYCANDNDSYKWYCFNP